MYKLIAPRIVVVGNTNCGKSSLVNAIVNQQVSIVSDVAGTTTDAVKKRFELLDFGPVDIIDTAGLDDESELGSQRIEKSKREINSADLILYCDDKGLFANKDIDQKKTIKIKTKSDINMDGSADIYVSVSDSKSVDNLIKLIFDRISIQKEPTLLEGLLNKGSKVLHIIPIDSEAPKGRIILPQVQMLRECLDKGIISTVIQLEQISQIDTSQFDLVICDSQVFKEVEKAIPENVMLTSYSILFARQKGEIGFLVEGANQIDNLTERSQVLIFESCSHNVSHEDIGTVKIPMLLKKYLGFSPIIENRMSLDFPENISNYDLVIHCGSCMLGRATMQSRIEKAKQANVPMTNYGVAIAYMNGIVKRATKILNHNGE